MVTKICFWLKVMRMAALASESNIARTINSCSKKQVFYVAAEADLSTILRGPPVTITEVTAVQPGRAGTDPRRQLPKGSKPR